MAEQKVLSCAVCSTVLSVSKQRRSLNPAASVSNKKVVDFLSTLSPELELTDRSVCRLCFTQLEKAAKSLATAENIANVLREKLSLPPIRFVRGEIVRRDVCRMPSPSKSKRERQKACASGIGRKRPPEECDLSMRRFQRRKSLQFSAQSSPLIEEVGCASVCICVYL